MKLASVRLTLSVSVTFIFELVTYTHTVSFTAVVLYSLTSEE